MSTAREPSGDRALVAVSNALAGVLREAAGRGPSRCTGHWASNDLLVILLHGGFTAAERTLISGGAAADVRASRLALKDVLATRMTEVVEEITGRRVSAYMSASHQDPDYQLEAFALEPAQDQMPAPSVATMGAERSVGGDG